MSAQQPKGQPASGPRILRHHRPETLQSVRGVQPGQQAFFVKGEDGQYQLFQILPGPATTNLTRTSTPTPGTQPVTLRTQTVATAPRRVVAVNPAAVGGMTTMSATGQNLQTVTTVQRPTSTNTATKEATAKCHNFLANLLKLTSNELSLQTLIQELIDKKVEPEDFCVKLEQLLNNNCQIGLAGFLERGLPSLRLSLFTKKLSIAGIRPPSANVVLSVASPATPMQAQVKPGLAANQVRTAKEGAAVVRNGKVVFDKRLVTPFSRGSASQAKQIVMKPPPNTNVLVSNSQPPVLHPVFLGNQIKWQVVNTRQPIQSKSSMMAAVKVQEMKPAVSAPVSQPTAKDKEKKSLSSEVHIIDDDLNDVAAMGGVNLLEEAQKIMRLARSVGTEIRSSKENLLCSMGPLQKRIKRIMAKHGLEEPGDDVAAYISHAAQERITNMLQQLSIITDHRQNTPEKDHEQYEVTNDVRGQLKFLADVDRAERERNEAMEREELLRAAKSRSKIEDPEKVKLMAKAKEMQRVEMEELRKREADATALQAIGPRKKPRLDGDAASGSAQTNSGGPNVGSSQVPLRPKKATLRDLQFVFEQDKELSKSKLLYKLYLM